MERWPLGRFCAASGNDGSRWVGVELLQLSLLFVRGSNAGTMRSTCDQAYWSWVVFASQCGESAHRQISFLRA